MTYLLNVSFLIKEELEEPVMEWINDEFIPVVTDPVLGFNKFEIFKLITPKDEGNLTLCLQVRSTNRKKLQNWFEEAGFDICNKLYKKYAEADGKSDVVIFPSLMESMSSY